MGEGPSILSTRFQSSSADTSARPHAAASRRRILVTRQALLTRLAVLGGVSFVVRSSGGVSDVFCRAHVHKEDDDEAT
jgi:hypothetical protein